MLRTCRRNRFSIICAIIFVVVIVVNFCELVYKYDRSLTVINSNAHVKRKENVEPDFEQIDSKVFGKQGLNDQYSDSFSEGHQYQENKLQEIEPDSEWVHRMNQLFENAPTENFDKDPFIRQNTSNGACENFYPTFKENLYKVLNYSLNVPKKYLEMLSLDDAGIRNLTEHDLNSPYPVMASAASSNHFREIQGLIRDYHKKLLPIYPGMKLILFDLGLNAKQLKLMTKYCKCEVRQFPFQIFPDHIRILSGYGWKSLIIQLLLQEFDFVMWTDASIRFNGRPLDKLFQGAKEVGVQAIPGSGSIAVRTNQRTFTALGEEMCLFDYHEFEAGWMAVVRSEFTLTAVMRPWVSCALQYGCMDFKNSRSFLGCPLRKQRYGACHRFDQSVLGIILTRLFNYKSHLCQFIVNGIGFIRRGDYVNYFPNS